MPMLKEKCEVSSWPGTCLIDQIAYLFRFSYNSKVVAYIKEVTDCLFDWVQPNLPEDLCLYRADGSVWLVTVTHEKDAYLLINEGEKEEMKRRIPYLYDFLMTR